MLPLQFIPRANNTHSVSGGECRYGFNGKELDQEGMGGGGSTYDYGFRIYNAQIAKFLSVDPLTPYHYARNSPIQAIDIEGLEAFFIHETNHVPDVWTSELVAPTTKALYELTNSKVDANTHFVWSGSSSEIIRTRDGEIEPEEKQLNWQFNNLENRQVAAVLLVQYVLDERAKPENANEEVTLIGYSYGGNIRVYKIENREVSSGLLNNHYLEKVDPEEIKKSTQQKLEPVPKI